MLEWGSDWIMLILSYVWLNWWLRNSTRGSIDTALLEYNVHGMKYGIPLARMTSVSEQLRAYLSPSLALTLTFYQLTVARLR